MREPTRMSTGVNTGGKEEQPQGGRQEKRRAPILRNIYGVILSAPSLLLSPRGFLSPLSRSLSARRTYEPARNPDSSRDSRYVPHCFSWYVRPGYSSVSPLPPASPSHLFNRSSFLLAYSLCTYSALLPVSSFVRYVSTPCCGGFENTSHIIPTNFLSPLSSLKRVSAGIE